MALGIAFSRDIKTALSGVAKQHGVVIDGEVLEMVADTIVRQIASKTEAVDDFKQHCHLYGLQPSDLGREFRSGSATYKITGLVPSRPKYPISATNVRTGRGYKFSERQIPFAQVRPTIPTMNLNFTAPTVNLGTCSNTDKFDFGKGTTVGQCKNIATTRRKEGLGRGGAMKPYCADCAKLIDDARAEMAAEARCS